MAPKFRPATDEDVVPIIDLWTRAGLVVPHNDPERDIAFARSVDNAEILVAEAFGRMVAAGMVGHDGHRGWVYYIGVDPDQGGKGLGRALMNACVGWLRDHGVPKAMLMIRPTNTAVRDFYKALGWEDEAVITMKKWLNDDSPSIGLGTVDTTVTSLEIAARPTRVATHPPSNIRLSLMRAAPPSLPFYRWLYEEVGREWVWVSRRLMSDQALRQIIEDPLVEVYVLYIDGTPAGFGEIDRRTGPSSVELAYFGLMPHAIGRGVGRYFIDAMVDLAWLKETERLWVHTCDLDHPRALGMYQRAGFQPFEQYTETLPDPRLAGLPLPSKGHADEPVIPLRPNTVTPIRPVS
jgi:ribosomal protein S18 acetylase RimI-like enzyme